MHRIPVQILAEGFLHPAHSLEQEVVDAHDFVHVPVSSLDSHVQFFRCHVESAIAAVSVEYILADAPTPADRERVQHALSTRFPDSTMLFLQSQATGRAVVDCPPESPLTQDAAAAVAVVVYSAAGDDSETIAVEGGGSRHVFTVGFDDTGHWAQPFVAGE